MAKLKTLRLENYRNLKGITLSFDGANASIVGRNRIGKTNCIEALCYLLTGKLLGGSSDIQSIKPLDNTRAIVVVEGTFSTKDGDVTLRKEYSEKWVRPRGSCNEEMQGHIVELFVNGAKQAKASSYEAAVIEKLGVPSSFEGLDAIQLMLDPFYFGEAICGSKDWKLARNAVISIIGDVSNEEVFAKNPDTLISKKDLEAHQYNDAETKKALRGEIDSYKKKDALCDNAIMEHERTPYVEQMDYDEAKSKCEELSERMALIKNGSSNPYEKEISELQKELYSTHNEISKQSMKPIDHDKSNNLYVEYRKEFEKAKVLKDESDERSYKRGVIEKELEELRGKKEKITKEALEIKEEAKNIEVVDTCPTCGQRLPIERIEEAKNEALANLKEQFKELTTKAHSVNAQIEDKEKVLSMLPPIDNEREIDEYYERASELKEAYEKALEEESKSKPCVDTSLIEREKAIKERLESLLERKAVSSKEKDEEISSLKSQYGEYEAIVIAKSAYERSQKRIEELKEDKVANGKAMALAEQKMWAIDEFVKTKLEILNEKMESKFGEVRFQLISPNIKSGSYDEVCKPYIVSPRTKKSTSTLFDSGSKSEQIYTGIQIIKAIRNAKGWESLPIVFDQGGELDRYTQALMSEEAEAQLISVKVEGESQTPTAIIH